MSQDMVGVTKQRADQLRREPDFPAPVDRWARGDLWAAAEFEGGARTYAGGEARWGPRSSRFLAGAVKSQVEQFLDSCSASLDARPTSFDGFLHA
jgi:hypothetical protein